MAAASDPGNIGKQFMIDGTFVKAEPFGCGHINDTYAFTCRSGGGQERRYILQSINTRVFRDPVRLMDNIRNITDYLRQIILRDGGDPDRETLTLIPTVSGEMFHTDEQGVCWRVYHFIERATAYQKVEKPEHFYKAGKAFGKFQRLLRDYPADTLAETIPDFHNTGKRFEDLLEAVSADRAGRAGEAGEEIAFAMRRRPDAMVLTGLLREGAFPLRVTHNDTKINNVMLDDATEEGICVIDLDTVMPGLSMYDFGDSIRFGASTAEEDERDLSKVRLDLDLFEEFTKGFLEEAGESLTPAEIDYLAFASKIMTYECGIRFLTDHLNGDTYFKISREGHNLDRCRTQFRLVEDMESKMGAMRAIVDRYRGGEAGGR